MAKADNKNNKKNWLLVVIAVVLILVFFGSYKLFRRPPTREISDEEKIRKLLTEPSAAVPLNPNPKIIQMLTAPADNNAGR